MIKPLLILAAGCTSFMLATSGSAQTASASVTQAAVEPARLAAAKITVDHIFPAGTYAKLMSVMTNQMMDQIMDSITSIPMADLAQSTGAKPEMIATLGKGTLADIMAIYDPSYKQRSNATIDAMMPVLIDIMAKMEPSLREGLTSAYAKRFTVDQLNDMNRFFDTPSGTAYAINAMLIQQDPEVVSRMTQGLPDMMRSLIAQMPAIQQKAKAATANLPKVRQYKDLTPSERARLATLLGLTEKDLSDNNAAKSKAKK